MRTPLLTVAITAIASGLLIAPAMQKSAHAQVYGGHGAGGTKSSEIILVGKGGGGGGMRGGSFGGGGMRAGGGFKGGLSGGGMRAGGGFKGGLSGGGLRAGGGGFKGGLSRPGGSFKGAYRGSLKGYGGPKRNFAAGARGSMKGLKGRNLAAHWNNGKRHAANGRASTAISTAASTAAIGGTRPSAFTRTTTAMAIASGCETGRGSAAALIGGAATSNASLIINHCGPFDRGALALRFGFPGGQSLRRTPRTGLTRKKIVSTTLNHDS